MRVSLNLGGARVGRCSKGGNLPTDSSFCEPGANGVARAIGATGAVRCLTMKFDVPGLEFMGATRCGIEGELEPDEVAGGGVGGGGLCSITAGESPTLCFAADNRAARLPDSVVLSSFDELVEGIVNVDGLFVSGGSR